MTREIAIHMGRNGKAATLYERGKTVIYKRTQGIWTLQQEKDFFLQQGQDVPAMRRQMEELIQFLGDCKILITSAMNGIPYYELEKAGCKIWECSGSPRELLDHVWEKEQQRILTKNNPVASMPIPENLGNGCFRISIKGVQGCGAGVSSKQVLLPFLRQVPFGQLEVLCSHIPPWVEAETVARDLTCATERLGPDEYKLILRKKSDEADL
ncbi:Fe-only nitrogenase accessory AnfO family protein [Desulforamulus ruminis]|uniref:Nitrogenase iron-iron accessory protein AnfO n=1 Tax=Desulforamulus ruminis (strain ATCC 23193 / DSM 2154 / NCIMB 8452 / DL) TaxID=696281 RepID=F6DPU2_DESRL|nr:Fe-only nitrogenase accessory AnfO family protein [Desulforamulus ruminis]AEG60781.1 Nitrogenase iron-iron accessory protein AnfO [Desulforamulus ruminis DSM 2154]